MLDMRLFENPRFTGASVAIMLVFFALFGTLFLLTQYLQFVLGYDPLRAGLAVAPVALALLVTAPLTPLLMARVGTKVMVTTGLVIVSAGLAILSTAGVSSGNGLVLATILILGVGMGLATAPATDWVMGSLPLARAGVGSAVNDTTRLVGGSLGVAILGTILSASYHASIAGSVAIARLPSSAAAAASNSLGGAVDVAGHLGGGAAQNRPQCGQPGIRPRHGPSRAGGSGGGPGRRHLRPRLVACPGGCIRRRRRHTRARPRSGRRARWRG
jgi:MFS family permease